jgi:hypothetical protein
MDSNLLFLSTFLCILSTALGLQCYKCDRDHWNWGACTTQIETCRPFQDACTSYTAYTLPTYFTQRGERYHQISKGCDTLEGCNKRLDAVNPSTCSRSSFEDWGCIECCTGDLCNYFVTLGAGSLHYSLMTLLAVAMLTLINIIRTPWTNLAMTMAQLSVQDCASNDKSHRLPVTCTYIETLLLLLLQQPVMTDDFAERQMHVSNYSFVCCSHRQITFNVYVYNVL